jgi:hypothetical protein
MDLTTATPVEIDTELSRLWNQEAQAESNRLSLVVSLHAQVGDKARRVRGARGPIFSLSWEKVLEQAIIKARAPYTERESYTAREIDRLLTNWAMASRKLEDLAEEIKVYTDEYRRRGGWNRVFMAQSANGHAHNGTECSTCHNGEERTQFAWLVRYSGKTEEEIVADAGERACTTCYPTAPADAKGTKMFTPDEEEAQRRREEREAARVEKARQADIKGITTPEGKPLDIGSNGFKDVAKTLRTAETAATDFLVSLLQEKRYAADPTLAWMYEGGITTEKRQDKHAHMAWWTIRAIAAKKGQTFEETFQVHEKKAEAKLRKMDREWAKDPRNPNRAK